MAKKLTPEEKLARKAEIAAREATAHLEYEQARATYKANLPRRIKDAQNLATVLGVATHIELINSGPSVRFEYEDHTYNLYVDTILTFDSDEWEIELLEEDLVKIKEKKDAYEARRVLAQEAWDKLTVGERLAIKEHLIWLKS